MLLSESDTRAKPIDPALHARGWTEDFIGREETAGAIEIVDGKPRKQSRGRIDDTWSGVPPCTPVTRSMLSPPT